MTELNTIREQKGVTDTSPVPLTKQNTKKTNKFQTRVIHRVK